MTISTETDGPVFIVTIERPAVRNAVDPPTAEALRAAFRGFDSDPVLSVAVLTGADGTFCAGYDLKAVARGEVGALSESDGPMGPTRMRLTKPVLAAIEGYAVAGGLELALWCDLRIAASDAVLGVFNRRFGVPLIDGGTVRLPRLIGASQASDLILTGRAVNAPEALQMGLVNRVVDPGRALSETVELAGEVAAFPQATLRADRLSALAAQDADEAEALDQEANRGVEALSSGEGVAGATRFAAGEGRHGVFE
jgi:enoyl-CoA hydratase